jgi:hypothetical protein
VDIDEAYRQWAADAELLGEIGRALGRQPIEVVVKLPVALAERALESWQRDTTNLALPDPETAEQLRIRRRAASASLIGCSVESAGVTEGDEVTVSLSAWFVGDALTAADEDGILDR